MTFGHTEPVPIYFDDLDAMGLLHNARYSLLVERAIVAFWSSHGWSFDPAQSKFPNDGYLVVREFSVVYRAPIVGTSTALVNFWIDQLGQTSAVYGFQVTSGDGSVVHAEGRRVNVNVDPDTLRPVPFSQELRAVAAILERPR